jgi:hypothetical protein
VQEGEIIQDEGDLLPEERGDVIDDHESRVLHVVEQLALPLSVLAQPQYLLYRFPD